jgi:hypothetical protein
MLFPNLQYHRKRYSRCSPPRRQTEGRRSLRFTVEQLEDRMVPSSFTAATVSELITDINAANLAGGSNTIALTAPTTAPYVLTVVDNTANGATGLPVIAANDNLTIQGNGATIARSAATGTPAFRIFDVASGASLTLTNLTIANGLEIGGKGMTANGGAILNEAGGSLIVNYTALMGNQAIGGDGGRQVGGLGHGGAIENDGTANLDHDTFTGNQAIGGATRNPNGKGLGGQGHGGAIGNGTLGTLTVTNCWFTGNQAIGGLKHSPSNQFDGLAVGGAVSNWDVAVVSDSVFTDNAAIGGAADPGVEGGYSLGGAIDSGTRHTSSATMTLQRCTFSGNKAVCPDLGTAAQPGTAAGTAAGGAIATGYTLATSAMTIADCTFTANHAIGGNGPLGGWGQGGAILAESPPTGTTGTTTLTIARSNFTANQAVGGGAGGAGQGGAIINIDWNVDGGTGATLTISDCTFTANTALGAAGGNGDPNTGPAFAESGAVDTSGNTSIERSMIQNNRAIGGSLSPGATPSWFTASIGGGLSSWGGTLYIADSSFVGNQAIGASGGVGVAGSAAMGGAIEVDNGLPTTIINCLISNNTVVGGAGGGGAPGGAGVGGGIDVELALTPDAYGLAAGPRTTVTITGTSITNNKAIGGNGGSGAIGGNGMGGGYSVGTGVVFGSPDSSTVTINGGSQVVNNAAIGGTGGLAGNGGNGKGGGIVVLAGSTTVSGSTINANQAIGGASGTGGNGGNGQGGGLYNQGIVTLTQSTITGNKAKGGAAGSNGLAGMGVGGGIFNVGTIFFDPLTVIFGNIADLFPDCFGC